METFNEKIRYFINTKKYFKGIIIKNNFKSLSPMNEKEKTFYDKFLSSDSKYQIKDDSLYTIADKKDHYQIFKSPDNIKPSKIYSEVLDSLISINIEDDNNHLVNINTKNDFFITEDDIICLHCGAVIDNGLSVIVNVNDYIHKYTCPKCNKRGPFAVYNKYTKSFINY